MKQIYMDFAATSPVKDKVLQAMLPYFSNNFGNPSSIHRFGRVARKAVEDSRAVVAKFFKVSPEEIIFTSGGTESDNLAIKGLINVLNLSATYKPHIITSAFEHHAVLETCEDLERRGFAEVTYIKPNKDGIVAPEDVKDAIKKNTVLVTIMYVNNEIGTVQPIEKIAKIVKKINKNIYIHTDAVQAIEYQPCDIAKLGVDMLSLSAHKFGGPKGVGVLFLAKGIKIHRENIGGAQEFKLRAGTENVPGIVGMAQALAMLNKQKITDIQKLEKNRDYFISEILTKIPDCFLNGSAILRNPNNINISFKYIEGEAILLHLNAVGIAASSGSACTSGSLDPSHVLLAIGLRHEDAHGSIRFTIDSNTTKKDIDYVVKNLERIVPMLRKMSPVAE